MNDTAPDHPERSKTRSNESCSRMRGLSFDKQNNYPIRTVHLQPTPAFTTLLAN